MSHTDHKDAFNAKRSQTDLCIRCGQPNTTDHLCSDEPVDAQDDALDDGKPWPFPDLPVSPGNPFARYGQLDGVQHDGAPS